MFRYIWYQWLSVHCTHPEPSKKDCQPATSAKADDGVEDVAMLRTMVGRAIMNGDDLEQLTRS